jgi:hypothetical protein
MTTESHVTFLLRHHVRARLARGCRAPAQRAQPRANGAAGTPHLPVGTLGRVSRRASSTSAGYGAAGRSGAGHRGGSALRLGAAPARLRRSCLRGRATRPSGTRTRGADLVEQRVLGRTGNGRREQAGSRNESVQVLHTSLSAGFRKSGPPAAACFSKCLLPIGHRQRLLMPRVYDSGRKTLCLGTRLRPPRGLSDILNTEDPPSTEKGRLQFLS